MTAPSHTNGTEGFTIVETIVTLIVLTIFLTGFFQAYMLMTSQRVKVARQAAASDMAYTNLRKVLSRPAGLTCNASTGHTLLSSTNGTNDTTRIYSAENDQMLGEFRDQTVVAYPTAGCTDFATHPVKIVSTVVFDKNKPGGEVRIVHASYIP